MMPYLLHRMARGGWLFCPASPGLSLFVEKEIRSKSSAWHFCNFMLLLFVENCYISKFITKTVGF